MKAGRMISRLRLPHRAVWLSLLLVLGIVASSASRTAYAGYADGTGSGQYQSQIYWLEWDGFSFTNGSSKTFNLPGGVTVTATVSNVGGGAVSVSQTASFAAMKLAYPNTGMTSINSCDGCTNTFSLTFAASVAGSPVPVDLVATDAEAAGSTGEYLKVTSDGNPWQLLEQFQAQNLRATFSNSDKTLELRGNGATTYGTVLAVSTSVTNFDFELKGGGISAAALGVFLPFDYGDAPASYSDAGHYMRQTFTGGLPGATKVYDPVSTTFTSFATLASNPLVYLGAIQPDADPGTQNSGANATNALGDDTNNTDDEDGVSSFPPLVPGATSYALTAIVNNTSGSAATLYGWVDFDGNGKFAANEIATTPVPNSSTNVPLTLNWSAITVSASAGANTFARLRITTEAISDNGSTPDVDERAVSPVIDGEVEDYRIQGSDFGDAPKDLSSIDASLTNAYPTLLADNGPRHLLDPAKRLGALIDGEADGQPNLAANGDDLNNLNDEDGVAFNSALGITTANVILSGVSNNLVATASAAGFLSAWIDYNQNGTFTDAGEQLFNDHAVAAGANPLTFTTPNTAPHGTTYMRFRYSTQSGVANTVTGQAPDGEVEDYKVEVALPAPTTCAAGLVNGSFEEPVLASGSNIYASDQVPGWAFRAANPSSGSSFFERHAIEIWTNGFLGVPAYQGRQFAEINGYVSGNLYQDVMTVPGSTLAWTVAHRGRNGTDVMAVKIGPPGATVVQQSLSDDNTQWRVYSGSYIVPAGQTITRFEFEATSSAGGDPSLGNLVDAISFSLPCDYGDAPDSYGTTAGASGASHVIVPALRLGTVATDAEGTGFPSVNADGDNLNNTNDEESLATLPPLHANDTAYALTAIPLLNNTGSDATLYGWVDFNRNGTFDAAEGVSTTVPSNAAPQTASLTWSGLSGLVAGQSYVRLRLSNQGGLTATGLGGSGEVEDYALLIQTPLAVTLASFDAAAQTDHVLVTWETVSELNNAGFNLYRTETSTPPAAANLLATVPSQGPGSTQGFFYTYQDYAVTPGETYWYWLEDVSLSGATTLHEPVSVVFVGPTAVTLSGLEANSNQPAFSSWPWLLLLAAAALVTAGVARVRRKNA